MSITRGVISSVTRRCVLGAGAGFGALVVGGSGFMATPALSSEVEDLISEFTGGVEPGSGKISLGAPQIAENGNTVPINVNVESPMSEDDHVSEVMVVAPANPSPGVVRFKFTAMSGKAAASTRIRLAKTQELIAIAKMSDGTFVRDAKMVKVTIGGCGG